MTKECFDPTHHDIMKHMESAVLEFSATFLIWILYASFIVLWFVDGRVKREQIFKAIIAGMLAWTIAEGIKLAFPTLRPYMLNGEPVGVLITPVGSAFPSAHTALAFSLAVTIFLLDGKIGWIYLSIAMFIGIARVLANVHYPVDILGGAFLGTIVAIILEKTHMFGILKKRK